MLDDPKEAPVTNTPLVDALINTVVDSAAEYTKDAAKSAVKRSAAQPDTSSPSVSAPDIVFGYSRWMRAMTNKIVAFTVASVLSFSGAVFAQSQTNGPSTPTPNPNGSVIQPQGATGPINTMSGGAPASSPQGESPPGMQPAPEGSDKKVRTDASGIPEGTPKN
jgi:hypothetical protein